MKRLCPHLPLPSYRYIPGQGPKDEHRDDLPRVKVEDLPPERWTENQAYLYGMDLYHHEFFYEAHEVWEQLWHKVGHKTVQGQYLKALIQLAALRLKLLLKQPRPAERLRGSAQNGLNRVLESGQCDGEGLFMGIPIPKLLKEVKSGDIVLEPEIPA